MPPRRSARAAASAVAAPTSVPRYTADIESDDSDALSSPPPSSTKGTPQATKKQDNDLSDEEADATDEESGSNASPAPPPARARTRATKKLKLTDEDFPDTQRGGKAAMEVYNTPEIRKEIFELVDSATLAAILTVEKAVTASVAAVLYRTVHVSIITRMSRATERRRIYCDAVKTLDINPIPSKPARRRYRPGFGYGVPPSPFNPSLLKDLPSWRKKFPQLQTILRNRPANLDEDDIFTVHLSDAAEVTVRLDSTHRMSITTYPTVGTPVLPSTPVYSGYDIQYSITLTVTGGYHLGAWIPNTGTRGPNQPEPTLDAWRTWLFCDPSLDRRVSVIFLEDCPIKLSTEEVTAHITSRKLSRGPPLRFALPPVDDIDINGLQQIVNRLGPQLTSLHLTSSTLATVNDWPAVISVLDAGLPLLESLSVSAKAEARADRGVEPLIPPSASLVGLPALLEFHFPTANKEDQLELARSIFRLGCEECRFNTSVRDGNSFNKLVARLKSPLSQYASLHTLQSRDLDFFSAADIAQYSFDSEEGGYRRVAWNTVSTYADQLSAAEEKFNSSVAQHQTAVQTLQQSLARITDGLAEANGDPQAESVILKREFGTVMKDRKAMSRACQATKALAVDMDRKSKSIMYYASSWLDKQPAEEKKKGAVEVEMAKEEDTDEDEDEDE